jgi:hypothetical protein
MVNISQDPIVNSENSSFFGVDVTGKQRPLRWLYQKSFKKL